MKPLFPLILTVPLVLGCAVQKATRTASIAVPMEAAASSEPPVMKAKKSAYALEAIVPSPAWEIGSGTAEDRASSKLKILLMKITVGPANDTLAKLMAAPVPRMKGTPYEEALALAEAAKKLARGTRIGTIEPKDDPNLAGFRDTVFKDGKPFTKGVTRVMRFPELDDRWVVVFASWDVMVDEEVSKDVEAIIASLKLVPISRQTKHP